MTAGVRRVPGTVLLMWLASVALAGCTGGGDSSRDRPSDPLYRSLSAGGDRVMVHREDGDERHLSMKLRMSTNRATVYGSELTRAGEVAWSRGDSPEVRIRAVDDARWRSLPIKNGIWEWPGHVRVEQTGRGWAVFGSDARWLGRLYLTEAGDWRLDIDGRDLMVRESGRHWTVGGVSDAEAPLTPPRWSVAFGEIPHPVALAVAFDELSAMERVAVGAAVDVQQQNRDGRPSEGG